MDWLASFGFDVGDIGMIIDPDSDFVQILISIINLGVGILIAINVAKVSRQAERVQNAQAIYEQWTKKKELGMIYDSITKADIEIYNPDKNYDIEKQKRDIYIILIIDVLFNSYVALQKGAFPPSVFNADMDAHMGALIRYDAELIKRLMVERGYIGEGVVGEFYDLVMSRIDNYETTMA